MDQTRFVLAVWARQAIEAKSAAGLVTDLVAVQHGAAPVAVPYRALANGFVERKDRFRRDDAAVELRAGQANIMPHGLVLVLYGGGERCDDLGLAVPGVSVKPGDKEKRHDRK